MNKKLIFMMLSFILLSACAQSPQTIYTWGDYVETSTSYATKGDEKEYVEKHLSEIKKIIDQSEMEKRRVAPGIYAEYAQLLYEEGKQEEAKKYFLLEKETYPESEVFIDNVLAKLYKEGA
jgi:hypothetical protein